jgi:hypothetical protein
MVFGQKKTSVGSNAGFGAVALGVSRNCESFDALGKWQIGQECLVVLC